MGKIKRVRRSAATWCRGLAGDHPVVRVSRKSITSATHLPIKRRQEDIAQQRRHHATLRRATYCRKESALAVTAGREHRLDQAQHSSVRYTLSHQREEFLVFDGAEEVLQIRIHDPPAPAFDLLPHFTQRILRRSPSPVPEVGFIKYRFEDRLQPIEQCLLTHPIINRRNAKHSLLIPSARL